MVIYDPSGGAIPCGEGPIVHIPFEKLGAMDSEGIVRIEEAILADPHGRPVRTTLTHEKTLAGGAVPDVYALGQNYPNPFNPWTSIEYELPYDGQVTLKLYNVRGQCVRRLLDEHKSAGYHRLLWDGRDAEGRPVGNGLYLYQLRAGGFVHTRKMILLK